MNIINKTIAVAAAATVTLCMPCSAVYRYESPSENNNEIVFCAAPSNEKGFAENSVYFDTINMKAAWDIEKGSSSVKVGIIDSGIYYPHQDMQGRVDTSLSIDFTGKNSPLTDSHDDYGHGTLVAGIIGMVGNNACGSTGVCWTGVTLVSYKADNAAHVTSAINTAANAGIKILNISGTTTVTNSLKTAIQNYPGLIVCSAGNNGKNMDSGNQIANLDYDNLLVVGATIQSGESISTYSNYGASDVDLFAPGDEIYSTTKNNGFTNSESGTSFAAPLVTGTVALLLSKYPNLSASELKNSIMNNVNKKDVFSGKCVSGGLLDAYKALTNIYCSHTAVKYVKRDAIMHDSVCTTCGQVTGSGMHVLLDSIAGYKICKFCKYQTMIGFKPGGDYNSIGDEQLSAQVVDGDTLCEDCAEHSHETTVIDELEELKESLVA